MKALLDEVMDTTVAAGKSFGSIMTDAGDAHNPSCTDIVRKILVWANLPQYSPSLSINSRL